MTDGIEVSTQWIIATRGFYSYVEYRELKYIILKKGKKKGNPSLRPWENYGDWEGGEGLHNFGDGSSVGIIPYYTIILQTAIKSLRKNES